MKTLSFYIGKSLITYYFYNGKWGFMFNKSFMEVVPWMQSIVEERHKKSGQIDLLTLIQLCF